jgi:hypothetical protein
MARSQSVHNNVAYNDLGSMGEDDGLLSGFRARVGGIGSFLGFLYLSLDRAERFEGNTPGPYRNNDQREIRKDGGSGEFVNPLVPIVRFPIGVWGLWWGTRRYLRGKNRDKRIGQLALAVGFLALLLPW